MGIIVEHNSKKRASDIFDGEESTRNTIARAEAVREGKADPGPQTQVCRSLKILYISFC